MRLPNTGKQPNQIAEQMVKTDPKNKHLREKLNKEFKMAVRRDKKEYYNICKDTEGRHRYQKRTFFPK